VTDASYRTPLMASTSPATIPPDAMVEVPTPQVSCACGEVMPVRNLLLLTILNFIFQPNSPLSFIQVSFLTTPHHRNKIKRIYWRHKYMVISKSSYCTCLSLSLPSNPNPSPFDARPTPRSPPILHQVSTPPPVSQRSLHFRVLPPQTSGGCTLGTGPGVDP